MISMPKVDKSAQHSHNHSVSTASAAASGRSSSWTQKDDETLKLARAQGMNWNQIAPKHFPNKTANACRKRHERLMERENAEKWDGGVKLDVLAQAYMEVRKEMWSLLAARVGEKWQVVETKCMEKGFKNLNQACRAAQKKHDGDSGIGHSDLEDSPDERMPSRALSDIPEAPFQYHQPYAPTQQRMPSIQNMLQYPPNPRHL